MCPKCDGRRWTTRTQHGQTIDSTAVCTFFLDRTIEDRTFAFSMIYTIIKINESQKVNLDQASGGWLLKDGIKCETRVEKQGIWGFQLIV